MVLSFKPLFIIVRKQITRLVLSSLIYVCFFGILSVLIAWSNFNILNFVLSVLFDLVDFEPRIWNEWGQNILCKCTLPSLFERFFNYNNSEPLKLLSRGYAILLAVTCTSGFHREPCSGPHIQPESCEISTESHNSA